MKKIILLLVAITMIVSYTITAQVAVNTDGFVYTVLQVDNKETLIEDVSMKKNIFLDYASFEVVDESRDQNINKNKYLL